MANLTEFPTSLVSGTTAVVERTYSDFPTTGGWTLTLHVAGKSRLTPLAATTSGSLYLFTLTAALTAALLKGEYQWEVRATKAGEAYTAESGVLTIIPNIAAAEAGELQSYAEATLAIVEAALSGRLTADMESYSIAGRSVTKIPVAELRKMRAELRQELHLTANPGTFMQEVRGVFTGVNSET